MEKFRKQKIYQRIKEGEAYIWNQMSYIKLYHTISLYIKKGTFVIIKYLKCKLY